MKEIVGFASNTFAVLEDSKVIPMVEVIVVLSEPRYKLSNSGDIVKERETEDVRIGLTKNSLKNLIGYLNTHLANLEQMDAEPEGEAKT